MHSNDCNKLDQLKHSKKRRMKDENPVLSILYSIDTFESTSKWIIDPIILTENYTNWNSDNECSYIWGKFDSTVSIFIWSDFKWILYKTFTLVNPKLSSSIKNPSKLFIQFFSNISECHYENIFGTENFMVYHYIIFGQFPRRK